METRTLNTSSKTVEQELKKHNVEKSISEYIWNGFDANAREVNVIFSLGDVETVVDISIADNGDGIDPSKLDKTFGLFLDSIKKNYSSPTGHGKKGRGRLSFFKFAGIAEWNSFSNGKGIGLRVESGALNEFSLEKNLAFNESKKGTKVRFSAINSRLCKSLVENNIIPFLQNEFSWLLYTGYKKLKIPTFEFELSEHEAITKPVMIDGISINFETVLWQHKQNTKSYINFVNSKGEIVHKELSRVNLKGEFYASSYVTSEWFDLFKVERGQLELDGECRNLDSIVFKKSLVEARNQLKDQYRLFRAKLSDLLIEQYESDGIFPEYNESNPLLNQLRKDTLIDVVKTLYEAEPDLFTKQLKLPQKKIFLKLLDRIISTENIDDFFEILHGVVLLEETEVVKLSKILGQTTLSNITKAIHNVHERNFVINSVDGLINEFQHETGEVAHLQKVVEENLWLFGEQYQILTAEEPAFEKALRELFKFHEREDVYIKGMIDHKDVKKQMDIFAIRRIQYFDSTTNKPYYKCLVVELKRPSETIKDKHLQQIETYQSVLQSSPEFNDGEHRWELILAGRKLSDTASPIIRSRLNSMKHSGQSGLITDDGVFKVYVKSWNQLLTEFEMTHSYLLDKLELKKSLIGKSPDSITHDVMNRKAV